MEPIEMSDIHLPGVQLSKALDVLLTVSEEQCYISPGF